MIFKFLKNTLKNALGIYILRNKEIFKNSLKMTFIIFIVIKTVAPHLHDDDASGGNNMTGKGQQLD